MKDWVGILIFVAIAIGNIMLEQNRQQKKKAARRPAAPASPVPPVRKRAPVQRRTEVQSERPVAKEPSLQEALQSLFENSRMEPHKEIPPALPPEPPKSPAKVVAPQAKPVPPVPPPQAGQPILTSGTAKTAVRCVSKSDFRTHAALRRAVIMSEVLAKPRGLQ